jgi:small subunit ribosomal protein S21
MSKKTTAPPPYESYSDHFSHLQVEVNHFDDSLRYFKSLVQKDKILSAFKEKQSYEKPSEKKRRKKREAAERRRITKMRDRMMATGEWDRRQKQKDKKRQDRVSRHRRDAESALE